MKRVINKNPSTHDHNNVMWLDAKNKPCGFGYEPKNKRGFYCITRCPECHQENYAMNVPTGYCSWCGFNANEETACQHAQPIE